MGPMSTSAFESIVAEHGATVQRVCTSILRDEHLGADAAQETFLRLWKRIHEGRAPTRFGGWLKRVAVTTALDLRRSRPRTSEDEGEPVLPRTPADVAAKNELERRFERAVAALPEGQRTVFVLRHSGGLRLREVAETLGLALPTVKTHFARACLKLQTTLAAFDEGSAEEDS